MPYGLATELIGKNAAGYQSVSEFLISVGDNPARLKSDATFAVLCGGSPIPASSGQTPWHRLNRGGDRAANSALHFIAIGRFGTDQRTKSFVAKRQSEALLKLEALGSVKRHIAREVNYCLRGRNIEINKVQNIS